MHGNDSAEVKNHADVHLISSLLCGAPKGVGFHFLGCLCHQLDSIRIGFQSCYG